MRFAFVIASLLAIALDAVRDAASSSPSDPYGFHLARSLDEECRPPIENRTFISAVIEEVIRNVTSQLSDPVISKIFECAFPNSLDTTVYFDNHDDYDTPLDWDSFVITGDIFALWLRDSTWQMKTYMPFANAKDSKVYTHAIDTDDDSDNNNGGHLYDMLLGLHNRHVQSLLHDIYANAFNHYYEPMNGHQSDDRVPPMTGWIFEGKYELDSIMSVLYYTNELYNITNLTCTEECNRAELFSLIINDDYLTVLEKVIDVLKFQQQSTHDAREDTDSEYYYYFRRQTQVPTDTLVSGVCSPSKRTGMVRSSFRPSDDATTYPFFIPANAMSVVALNETVLVMNEMINEYVNPNERVRIERMRYISESMFELSKEIENAIREYGLINGDILAYEVDGYGNYRIMDDANIPSLLSLPYLRFVSPDWNYTSQDIERNKWNEYYKRTRESVLFDGEKNAYYFSGVFGDGIGSPHTDDYHVDMIWPMSVIMRAMTSTDDQEITDALNILKSTTDYTYFMHESFEMDNPQFYTRSWFAWCNGMFGQLILKLLRERPWIVT